MCKVHSAGDFNLKQTSIKGVALLNPDRSGGKRWSPELTRTSSARHDLRPASTNTVMRDRMRDRIVVMIRSVFDIFMLNCLLVTPLVSIGGFIGLMLSADHPLHQVAPLLICAATFGFFLAISYSHVYREREQRAQRWQNQRVGPGTRPKEQRDPEAESRRDRGDIRAATS